MRVPASFWDEGLSVWPGGGLIVRTVKTRLLTSVVFCAAVGALAMSGLSGAGAAAALDEGVSANSIKIGYITSVTGAAGSTSGNAAVGCRARVGRENDKGGVNGRKLDVTYVDDRSSGANLTAAQDLVQNKHVFMVVDNSAFAFLTYQFLVDSGVPMMGGLDRRHLLRRTRQREHSFSLRKHAQRRSADAPREHPHVRHRGEGHEEDGRHESRRSGP